MVVSLSLIKGLFLVTLVFVDQYYIIRRVWSQLAVIPAYITKSQLRENLGGQWNRCSIVGRVPGSGNYKSGQLNAGNAGTTIPPDTKDLVEKEPRSPPFTCYQARRRIGC